MLAKARPKGTAVLAHIHKANPVVAGRTTNGEHTIVHAPTNLHALERSLDAAKREIPVALLASMPLTSENGRALSPVGTYVYKEGRRAG